MAKVRVYELARELDVESKELVKKLLAGGMDIKNYMSTLDEEAVIRARDIFFSVVSEVVEEKRIKGTVIRRRKRKVRQEQEIPAEKVIEEVKDLEGAEAVKVEPPSKEAEPQEMPDAERKEEIEEPPVDKHDQEAVPSPEVQAIPPTRVRKKRSAPAKEAPEAGPPTEKVKKEVPEEKAVKRKKPKKKKVEKAAKIIKRPEEGPLKDILAKKTPKKTVKPRAKETVPAKPSEIEIKSEIAKEPQKVKPSKKKMAKTKAEKLEDTPRVSVRYRKREVYEKADLYAGRSVRPKGKKGTKKVKEVARKLKQTEITVPKAIKRRIKIQKLVTVSELAKAIGVKSVELIKKLMTLGVTANINQSIDFDTASIMADDFGYELELDTFEEERFISEIEDRTEDQEPRPPVVTIMGHVDHGKTSLLDYIRKSNIIDAESGGITQHIGAYYVETKGGDIVFLDTPGHEAFTAMRARGAEITDLIVLVVAADDGVMPQTREAINHARAANIPIVVAVNKIDKAEADPEKVKRGLAELDLAPEEWGGETIFGHISAKTGDGVDELLSLILLQSEVLELRANPNKPARGSIIEAKLDKSKGPVATVLVKSGTLTKGSYFICGEHYGRVRAMNDHRGKKVKSAGPSLPVEIYGISGVPMAGDEFIVVQDERTAKQVSEHRRAVSKKQDTTKRGLVSLDDLFDRIKEGEVKELNIVLKADVQGSLEALGDSLVKQNTEEVKLKIIHSATGAIAESDVMLASASGAIIIGFNVRANPRVSEIAEKENVDIRYYDVIYKAISDIRLAMAGLLEPVYEETVIGHVDIKEIFHVPKVGSVAGCLVTDGYVERSANIRLLRDDVVVFDGKIASLRRFKEDAKEVQSGYECGIGLENFQDIKPGDVFEVYKVEEIEAEL